MENANKRISDVRSYFVDNYGHVNLDEISDGAILEFLGRSYIIGSSFEMKMNYLYDYVLSQGLCNVQE